MSGSHPLANNGLVVNDSERLMIECVSNSSESGLGSVIVPNQSILLPPARTDYWRIISPFRRPGVLRILNIDYGSLVTYTEQGIYTCSIPDSNGNEFVFNFGLYPEGFMGKINTPINPLLTQSLSQSPRLSPT